jgi:hypothetical protein
VSSFNRQARPVGAFVVIANDERELLLRFLRRQRAEVIATADGLTDQQARWTPDQRLLPIIGINEHLTHGEWRWINGATSVNRSQHEVRN